MLNPIEVGDKVMIDMAAIPGETGTHQVERERDDAILLLASLFDATGVGILVTDHFGNIVKTNEVFTSEYGWEKEEIINKEFTMMLPPEEREVSKKLHDAFIERGKNGTREIQILRKDGSLRDIWLTTVLLELSQNRRFIVSTLRDITERKNMIRNLKRSKELADASNKAKSVFLANMSHELRTPLNAIIGFTEMMRNETFGPIGNDKYTEYLGDIHFSARHLLEIINDVLDMSKIEAGKVELHESELNLDETFQSIEMIMSERAARAKVKLHFHVDEGVESLRADSRLVRQMLINLVANAVKFSKPNQEVTVSAKLMTDKKYLRISVKDSGCGIPKEKIEKALEPFGQISDPERSMGQGTGLGLPLTRAMIELHGGELVIESQEDKGTTVHLDFPIARTTSIEKQALSPQSL
jgi:PAS domain S-box-containing protein